MIMKDFLERFCPLPARFYTVSGALRAHVCPFLSVSAIFSHAFAPAFYPCKTAQGGPNPRPEGKKAPGRMPGRFFAL